MQNKFKPYICSNTQIRKKQSFEATCQLRENYSTISPNCAPAVLRGRIVNGTQNTVEVLASSEILLSRSALGPLN